MYDTNHKLTRAGAEQVIRNGGSVLMDGRLHTRVETLPSEADFAKGDVDAENAARENLVRQQQAISDQLAKLGAKPAAPKGAPAPKGAAAPKGAPAADAANDEDAKK